jgi:hypothetical protein
MAEQFAMTATAITATNAVTVLQAGFGNLDLVRSINLFNVHTANTTSIRVTVTRQSTASEFVFSMHTQVASLQRIEVLDQPLVLNANDSLRVACDPVDEVHVVTSHLAVFS